MILEAASVKATRKEFVLTMSRLIVNAFKSGTKHYTDFLVLPHGEEEAEVHMSIRFIKQPKQEVAFSINASFGPTKRKKDNSDTLEMLIDYNPKHFPSAMNEFVSEVKEVLEHEFEHIGQLNFDDMYVLSNRYKEPLAYPEEAPQAPDHYHYLTSNVEVPAYVKGLIKRAKTSKITFEQALDNYYDNYKQTFELYHTSWVKVKLNWINWYKAAMNKL